MAFVMRMCIAVCLLVCFAEYAVSLKCYQCVSTTFAACEQNETVVNCALGTSCATINTTLAYSVHLTLNTYMKNCIVPSKNCSSYFTETAQIKVKSCSYLRKCSTDYCNGVPPPTTPPTAHAPSTTPTDTPTAKRATTSGAKRLQGILSFAILLGLQICIFA